MITTCLNRLDGKRIREDDSDSDEVAQNEQAITKENLTEKKRVELLDFFGRKYPLHVQFYFRFN